MAGPTFADRLHQPTPEEPAHQDAPAAPLVETGPGVAAQAAADEVVARLGDPGGPVRRTPSAATDELGGTQVDPGVVTTLRRRAGRGQALDTTGAALGASLGVDPGRVRVHADREADTISRSMQATAFTWGNDIYFTQGAYSPTTTEGRHVLAHELGHVAQQKVGAYGGSPVIGRADDPAEREADQLADLAISSLNSSGGATQVATVPEDVSEGRELPTVRRLFGKVGKAISKVKDKVNTFFGKAKPVDDEKTGNDYVDDMSHEDRITHQRKARGSGPGENPDYTDTSLWGEDPNRFVVTLAVSQDNPAWMTNIKMLKKAAISELISSPKKFSAGLSDAEERLGRKVLLKQGALDGKTEEEIGALVKTFSKNLHHVGHTWVRLSTYVAPTTGKGKKAKPSGKGQLKELYSYGMWPQQIYDPQTQDYEGGYSGPLSVGPGEVHHPDTDHENDATKAYRDYEVTGDQFGKALGTAIDRYNSPPPYVLTGYNCTAFAREILQAAGQTYPGAGLLPGFAYTPGNLYWAIMQEWAKGNPAAHTMEQEEKAMARLKTRNETFSETGLKEVHSSHDKAMGIESSGSESDSDSGAPSLRQQFLDEGLCLYQGTGGGFKPPNGLDDEVIRFAAQDQIKLVMPQRTEGEWVEVIVRGDYFWVHEEHLRLFQNPNTPEALFDDEVSDVDDTDSDVDDLLEVSTTSAPQVEDDDLDLPTPEDMAPYALEKWKRLGVDLGLLEMMLPFTIEDDIKFTADDLYELLSGPSAATWCQEIAEGLGCEPEELMDRFGPRG